MLGAVLNGRGSVSVNKIVTGLLQVLLLWDHWLQLGYVLQRSSACRHKHSPAEDWERLPQRPDTWEASWRTNSFYVGKVEVSWKEGPLTRTLRQEAISRLQGRINWKSILAEILGELGRITKMNPTDIADDKSHYLTPLVFNLKYVSIETFTILIKINEQK